MSGGEGITPTSPPDTTTCLTIGLLDNDVDQKMKGGGFIQGFPWGDILDTHVARIT